MTICTMLLIKHTALVYDAMRRCKRIKFATILRRHTVIHECPVPAHSLNMALRPASIRPPMAPGVCRKQWLLIRVRDHSINRTERCEQQDSEYAQLCQLGELRQRIPHDMANSNSNKNDRIEMIGPDGGGITNAGTHPLVDILLDAPTQTRSRFRSKVECRTCS